ncbi:Possible sugar kinase [hydrothermal vent metagenome]|uniref:Possible sugar kinase n=1 Tax=hydrothermal vent metagenome TaxID=652676 RepID=A0A3B0TPR1_9ZZZZ
MQALFIGQTYIDVTFLADEIPRGDEKMVADTYSVSFGGNAVTAAFTCAKLGIKPELMTSLADDWLGNMFRDMAGSYGVALIPRKVAQSSLSFVMPKDGHRAIIRCRDANYLDPVPKVDLEGCRAIHMDGHQPDAALAYARRCRQKGIMTSLDGGTIRQNTLDLLEFIDVPVVSELFCEQLEKSPEDTLAYLHERGARIAGVTLGARGLIWSEAGGRAQTLPALPVPAPRVIDTNGAGDIFHGAYMYSYLNDPGRDWEAHFTFARAASAYGVQHLGNEASLPTLKNIQQVREEFGELVKA